MKEKLIIKNFGPIKSVELELGRFNVLIGEQATGKSTVVKLLAVCRYFSSLVKDADDFRADLEEWGLADYHKMGTKIFYECKHYSFHYSFDAGVELKALSSEFKELLEFHSVMTAYYQEPGHRIPTDFFQNNVAAILDNPFYLPPERGLQSIFSLGKSSLQNISDLLFNQFAKLDRIARIFKSDTVIEPLNIIYKNIDGKGFIKKENAGEYFSLFNAATGYQSAIPIILAIRYYNVGKKPKTFIIEEPELNLFPSTQQKLMQYLVFSIYSFNHSMLLTTHSPYILTSLNNMMYAYQTGQKHESEVEKVIPKENWINPADVAAYMMLPNGECENILDSEGLIKAEKIDGVSSVLNKDFNAIMDIELSVNQ